MNAGSNPPVYPQPVDDPHYNLGDGTYGVEAGISLRDHFAGKAIVGLLSDSALRDTPSAFARKAYDIADAMLVERLLPRGDA